jgi:hypothetical protein
MNDMSGSLELQLSRLRTEKQRLADRLRHVCKMEAVIVTKIVNERERKDRTDEEVS